MRTSLILHSFLLMPLLTGCGTEVGNGWNSGENEDKTQAEEGADSAQGSQTSMPGAYSEAQGGSGQDTKPVFLETLLNRCLSPFGEYPQDIEMYALSTEINEEATTLKNAESTITYGSHTLDYVLSNGTIDSTLTSKDSGCGEIATMADVEISGISQTFTMTTLEIRQDNIERRLSWYVDDSDDSLFQLSVTIDGSSQVFRKIE